MSTRKVNTIEGILNVFQDIANRHEMINDFGVGQTYNIGQERPMKYPYLWVEFIPTSVSVKPGVSLIATYSFDIYIMDKINKGDNNMIDSMSDMDAIINTVIVELSQSDTYKELGIKILDNIIKQPAQEKSDDNANGWVFTLNLTMPIRFSTCNIPILPC